MCLEYIDKLRELCRTKYNEITAFTLETIERYVIYTAQEMEENKRKAGGRKTDNNPNKPEFHLTEQGKDFKIGIWGNFTMKAYRHKPIEFVTLGMHCDLPRNMMLQSNIMRASWTSFNDLSHRAYCPDLVVGGIFEIELFAFPEMPKQIGKWLMRNIHSVEHQLIKYYYPDASTPP